MERKRVSTTTVARHINGSLNGAAALNSQQPSSDDEDMEVAAPEPPMQRASTRRQPRVDFSKLEMASLKRYRKVYKMGDVPPGATKEDLIPAIARHFAQQTVEEDDTLVNFALTLKRLSQARSSPQPTKKPRNGAKPKATGR